MMVKTMKRTIRTISAVALLQLLHHRLMMILVALIGAGKNSSQQCAAIDHLENRLQGLVLLGAQ